LAFEQYNQWLTDDKEIYKRLQKLIQETARTPFEGIGKPEALKHDFKGY
jgi:toxin YoeB